MQSETILRLYFINNKLLKYFSKFDGTWTPLALRSPESCKGLSPIKVRNEVKHSFAVMNILKTVQVLFWISLIEIVS